MRRQKNLQVRVVTLWSSFSGISAQGLELARQTLPLELHLLSMASHVPRITDTCHHVQLLIEMGLANFLPRLA
jgi:hypothetical protein